MTTEPIWCECCAEDCELEGSGDHGLITAQYALSLSESNSGANITFVCSGCFKAQIDFMLNLGVGSVDVQSMVESGKDT